LSATVEKIPFDDRLLPFLEANCAFGDLLPPIQERIKKDATWIAATSGSKLLGVAQLSFESDAAKVGELCVAKRERGKGIGRALLDRCVQEAGSSGKPKILVTGIDTRNLSARGFLVHIGFRILNDYVRMEWTPRPLPRVEVPVGYEIRTFRAGDEEGWASCINRAYSTQRDKTSWTAQSVAEKFVQNPSFIPDGCFFAVRDGRIVGAFMAWREIEAGPQRGRLHWLGIDPEHRNMGLAKLLSVRVLQYLLSHGFTSIFLDTSYAYPVAMQMYSKLGFVETPRLFDYVRDVV